MPITPFERKIFEDSFTDGRKADFHALDKASGGSIEYNELHKLFGQDPDATEYYLQQTLPNVNVDDRSKLSLWIFKTCYKSQISGHFRKKLGRQHRQIIERYSNREPKSTKNFDLVVAASALTRENPQNSLADFLIIMAKKQGVNGIQNAFLSYDVDGSGTITRDELKGEGYLQAMHNSVC